MFKIKRLAKAIGAFFESYRNDMSFAENSVFSRSETLIAVEENDKRIKLLESQALRPGSMQWKLLDNFLRKCLEKKLTPDILNLYRADNKLIPGLNLDVISLGNVGTGSFKQKITVTLHKQLLGIAEIESKIEDKKVMCSIDEQMLVK